MKRRFTAIHPALRTLIRPKARILLVTMLLLLGTGLATAGPASADTLGDPHATGCWQSDAWWSRAYSSVDGSVYLLYSPECNTNWGFFARTGGIDEVYVENANGDVGYDSVDQGGDGWTVMVYGGVSARACAHSPYSGWWCTDWF